MRKLVVSSIVLVFACSKPAPLASEASKGSANDGAAQSPGDASAAAASAASSGTANPDVISQASPPWTGPVTHVLVSGQKVDGSALRKMHSARIGADTTAVTLLQGTSPLHLGERLCEQVVPKRPASMPVLLKPNLGGFEWFKDAKAGGDNGVKGRITDPEFVRGVIHCLKKRGHTAITVAEGWGATHADWQRLIKVSGYEAMALSENVPLVAMDDDGVFDVEGNQPGKPLGISGMEKSAMPTLLMPKILAEHLDHGLYLSLPKMKDHRFGVVSVGIKGMQGTVMTSDAAPAFHQKWRSHRELSAALEEGKKHAPDAREHYVASLTKFATRMVDVLEIEAPDAVLAEGAPAMSGDGFRDLKPSRESVAIGGTNIVAVDKVASQFMGLYDNETLGRELLGHKSSPLLEEAATRFHVDLTHIAVLGNGAVLLTHKRPVHFVAMAGFQIDEPGDSDDAPPIPTAAQATMAAAAPSAFSELKTVHARHLEFAPDADLEAIERAMQAVPSLQFESTTHGDPSGVASRVAVVWNAHAVRFLWHLTQAGLHTDRSRDVSTERARLYEEDCVEIFLAPDPQIPSTYAEIEVGPYGHFFDLWVENAGKKSRTEWSSGLVVKTVQNASSHTATIAMTLTASDITRALKAGAHLPLGLFRMEGAAPRSYLAAFPANTAKPNFHIPSAFGTLVLDP